MPRLSSTVKAARGHVKIWGESLSRVSGGASGSVFPATAERRLNATPTTLETPSPAATDGELVLLARTGGEPGGRAFRALYERYADEVLGFLVRATGDATLAEDVLQEAFFRVHGNLERVDTARSLRPWLYQVARNAALDALRLRRKESRLAAAKASSSGGAEDVLSEVEAAEERERARDVVRALETLPDDERLLLIQRHQMGVPLEDLARSYSVSERTVRSRLQEAACRLAGVLRTMKGARS
jgi:RNA polymerase sigma-70 factor (ECF subfamily)